MVFETTSLLLAISSASILAWLYHTKQTIGEKYEI